jgi:hypothetical protein
VALSDDESETLARLYGQLTRAQRPLHRLNAYYDGDQRIEQLGLAVPPELQRFLTVVNWPGTYVDAIEQRLDVEGFRLPDQDGADQELWRIWQENDLDEESQLAHLDSLALGRSFVTVGAGDTAADGEDERDPATPLVTVESPREMTVELSPRTRRVSAAAKVYQDGLTKRATLYLPDVTIWLERVNARWQEEDRDEHGLGVVPVVPLVNRPRTARREGQSEMHRVIGLTDAAARALTNAQLATEIMAIPQRYVLGASKGDFVDKETGKALTTWEAYFGAIWALTNKDAKAGQFTAADLANFKTIIDHYATLVAGVTGLPMRYLGQNTANPPSADGIRADESRLIKTCERVQRGRGGSWERVARLIRRIIDGKWDRSLAQLETIWRDPATPTRAQAADAAVKLYTTSPKPIVPLRQTRESLGYSQVQIARMEEEDAREAARDPLNDIARGLAGGNAPPEPVIDPVPADAVAD